MYSNAQNWITSGCVPWDCKHKKQAAERFPQPAFLFDCSGRQKARNIVRVQIAGAIGVLIQIG